MSVFQYVITKVVTNGPYSYLVSKDGVGQKDVNNVADISTALDGVKSTIAGLLSGETVTQATGNVRSS